MYAELTGASVGETWPPGLVVFSGVVSGVEGAAV